MLNPFALSVAALVIALPSQARAQSQQAKVPIAKTTVAKTAAVKTRQKKSALTRLSAADRGVDPSNLTTVVAPNGEVRVIRRQRAVKSR